ncbi:MAG: GMC family oxidoreductase [Gemmatimonadaceae bacterium]
MDSSPSVRFQPSDTVDFVVVGSGAAGGVVARELSRAGFRIVVLEQGPRFSRADFHHDEIEVVMNHKLSVNQKTKPVTHRKTPNDAAKARPYLVYGVAVGGGTVHFTANFWRFRPIDFREFSTHGAVPGADMDDWPISYEELEPYYSKVEWDIGVSGQAGVNPKDPPRSRPFPLPPLPVNSAGVLMQLGGKKLGWSVQPAPMAIPSRPYQGREACHQCGWCYSFGCEWGAKSSTLFTMIPQAEATGRCEVRPLSYVRKVETNDRGRVTGVTYFDASRREVFQKARAVILCANGAETPRLLLMSASKAFPNGLANSSGYVGKRLMFNGGANVIAEFEHPLNGFKGAPVTMISHEHYELDPSLGLAGGGGIDFRFAVSPIEFANMSLPDRPSWGREYWAALKERFTRTVAGFGHTSSLPVLDNGISLDENVKDAWGLPAIRVTYRDHENDVRLEKYMGDRTKEMLDAAGAKSSVLLPISDDPGAGFHLLGTCRMGNDPRRSVVNAGHRAHDVPNLFIVDGSSFVTSGRGQPTMTIQALAFRAADQIAAAVKRGELGA